MLILASPDIYPPPRVSTIIDNDKLGTKNNISDRSPNDNQLYPNLDLFKSKRYEDQERYDQPNPLKEISPAHPTQKQSNQSNKKNKKLIK